MSQDNREGHVEQQKEKSILPPVLPDSSDDELQPPDVVDYAMNVVDFRSRMEEDKHAERMERLKSGIIFSDSEENFGMVFTMMIPGGEAGYCCDNLSPVHIVFEDVGLYQVDGRAIKIGVVDGMGGGAFPRDMAHILAECLKEVFCEEKSEDDLRNKHNQRKKIYEELHQVVTQKMYEFLLQKGYSKEILSENYQGQLPSKKMVYGGAVYLTAEISPEGVLDVFQSGDCGLVVIRDGKILGVTVRDRSKKNELTNGIVSWKDGETFLRRNPFYGMEGEKPVRLNKGDVILMGTDGLWDSATIAEIKKAVADKEQDVGKILEAVQDLVRKNVTENGGGDHVVVFAYKFNGNTEEEK